MQESWLTHNCLGVIAVIDEAYKQVNFNRINIMKAICQPVLYGCD